MFSDVYLIFPNTYLMISDGYLIFSDGYLIFPNTYLTVLKYTFDLCAAGEAKGGLLGSGAILAV